MKIDRKKIVNRCGYDQNECMLLAKRLSECPDDDLIPELKKISVWNYGKCELGLWADVLDRLDAILERAVTKVGKWMLKLDTPEETPLVDDVVTILEFTGHLIEHSIYRYLYGSWNHILALFGSENMDILLAVLGLSYNFSKRSNYFIRLDPYNKKMVLDRLVSIAETWGGAENNFGLAACCNPNHFPETAGNIYFEYRPSKPDEQAEIDSTSESAVDNRGRSSSLPWSTSHKIVLHALHKRNQSPSQIMEELLLQHPVPVSKQMALFARVRLATYFADPEQRHKCIRARLQALSILSYTFDVDERHLYPNLLDELVEVLELPDGQYMGIKACALRTMTAIVNSHRLGVDWTSLVGSTGLSNYHGILPNLTRRWIQGLVDGTVEAPSGSTNQQFTTALLSFLYHLACYEENVGSGNTQSTTLNSSGVLDTMLQLISWHNSRNDCLSYVTRAVRVTDQILMSISSSRQHVVTILVNRLNYEVDLVLKTSKDSKGFHDHGPALNTQRSGLMKSMLSLLKRLCLDTEWSDVMQAAMDGDLPNILRRIFLNGQTHFTPHLALFAMEAITNYLYTYPSRISAMQDKHITSDILKALTDQPLPQNRDFLVQLPGLFNTLALNSRGIEAIQSSGVLSQYLNTLVSPEYLPTMKTKRVRDFLSQISFNPTSSSSQTLSNSLTASQMSNAIQELLRSHNELKPTIFQGLVACLKRVVELGNMQPATLFPESALPVTGFPDLSDQDNKIHSFSPRTVEIQSRSSGSSSSHTTAAGGGTQTLSGTNSVSGPIEGQSGAMLDDDVVMLSGGEDEDDDDENDIDDVTRATQTVAQHSFQNIGPRLLDSRSVSPATSLSLKDATTPGTRTPTSDGTPIPPQLFLSDFLLNTCKFLEKLLPSVMHVTEAMCRHFVSHGGLQVLCDLLRMPGLPYDFPASPVCTSLCKIFEDLANFINLNDVIDPLFQCLEASVTKMSALYDSQFKGNSILLKEYMMHEHSYIHELVVTASIICIMVQMVDHVKPELRPLLANKWISRSLLPTLGRLYLGVSWEAGILLTLLSGDNDITEEDILTWKKYRTDYDNSRPGPSKAAEGDSKQSLNAIPIPQFVEVLHIYALLKPSKKSEAHPDQFVLRRYPELVKAACRILHVVTFLLNSLTELFTAWGRFFANRNPMNHRRRRINLITSDQIPTFTKYVALSQVSQVLTGLLSWEVPSSVSRHEVPPKLVCAMRYAAIRMTNLLLHDSGQKGPQGSMLHAFFFQGGVQRYFGLFRELLDLDLDDTELREPLTVVLEEWLACACRIGTTDSLVAELRRIADTDGSAVNVEEYVESIHQSMLFPLEQLCVRSDLQNLLTRGAVEHFVNMLVSIVPYLFNRAKLNQDDKHAVSRSHVVSTPVNSVLPDAATTSSVPNLTHEAGDATAVDLTRAQSTGIGASVELGEESAQVPDIQQMDQTGPLTGDIGIPIVTPMETENSQSCAEQVRDPAALQLMQEMGFSRELCLVALEQTDWNANEAVNLVIATPAEDLLSAAMNSPALARDSVLPNTTRVSEPPEPLDSVGEAPEWSAANLSTNAPDRSTSSLNLAATVAQCIEEALFVNRGSQQPSTRTPLLTQVANSSSQGDSPAKTVTALSTSSFQVKMLSPEHISALRESLKQNAFRACYAVAKLHHSDQILHRIAELLLSSGEEERYIDQLFGFVATSMSSQLGITAAGSSTFKCNSVLVEPVSEHPIVGLHLSALLFIRCQSLCARLAWQHDLPRLLVSWVSHIDWAPNYQHESKTCEPMDTDKIEVTGPTSDPDVSSRDTTKNYFQTMLLAMLILDQYERSVQAMELRKSSVGFYLNSHSWFWFDERAVLWHPYTIENTLAIDIPFHKGDLCAYCHISRRPYCVEFPTMTQMNLDSMHRRPILLLPSSSKSDCHPTEYERSILDTQIPPSLTAEQRRALYVAIIQHFESLSKMTIDPCDQLSNGRVPTLIPSKCVNAMLRLLLRLAYSDYSDANEMTDLNIFTALLNFPHEREFTAEYSAFVGILLTQMFDDEAIVDGVMRDVLCKMSQFGIPNGYMGINPSQTGCRDLFYLLGMCAPLFAKDSKTALKLTCEVMNLSLSDADVQAKTVPKTYVVEPVAKNSKPYMDNIPLSARQKGILTLLIELVVRPPNSICSRKQKLVQDSPCNYVEDTELHRDSDRYNTQNTGAPTLFTYSSLASSASTNWTSGPTGGNISGTSSYPQQQFLSGTSSSSTFVNNPTKSAFKMSNIVFLGRTDALRYLIDFVASYRPVAEFVALYKLSLPEPAFDSTERCTFLSHLFTHQLNHPETTELTASLLEHLVLVSSESTQATIMSEFKWSLGRIAAPICLFPPPGDNAVTSNDTMQSQKNDCLAAHMFFLERILSLPTPLVNRLIRIIYKRHIPSDVAKLIANVDCNLPNTQSTLSILVRTLESLTWVERQISKLPNIEQGHTSSATLSQNRTTAAQSGVSAQPHMIPDTSASVNAGNRSLDSRDLHSSEPQQPAEDLGPRSYETDSDDDDDDDDHDVRGQQQQNQGHSTTGGSESTTSRGNHLSTRVTSSNTTTLNMVLGNVLIGSQGQSNLIRPDSGHQATESRSSWHHSVGTSGQDDSIIFVHDDEEDEGSAGQGGEGENSQDDDVMEDDEDEDDDEDDDDEDDVEDDVEDEDAEGDEDQNRDDEHDDDISGDDEEVAFVLRGGPQTSSSGGRRPRRRNDAAISVSGGRVPTDLEPLEDERDEVDQQDREDEEADLVLRDDEVDEDDGSLDDDVVDTFARDEDDDLQLPDSNLTGHIFLSRSGQIVRGGNPVVAMVEEMFNLVDVPAATVSHRQSGSRRDRLPFSGSEASDTGLMQSGSSLGNWGLVLPSMGPVDGLPLRGPPPPPGFGIGPNASFRLGLGNGPGSGTPVLVTGGNSSRITQSGLNFLSSGHRIESVGPSYVSQTLPPPTLASQHPLLQVPSVPSRPAPQTTTSMYGPSTIPPNNARLNRTIITNTSSSQSGIRMTSTLPPAVPQLSSTMVSSINFGPRNRVALNSSVPIVIGNSGIRQRGPQTRLYGNADNLGSRTHIYASEHTSSNSVTNTMAVNVVRDNRTGPEADALVWNMLTSFAEDQPTPVNSALANAIFSHPSTSEDGPLGRGASQVNGLASAQLSSFAGCALPASYRQWITLSRMLFGHELMDLMLISRHNVYLELASRRQNTLDQRVRELEQLATQQEVSKSEPEQPVMPEGPIPLIVTQDASEGSTSTDVISSPPASTTCAVENNATITEAQSTQAESRTEPASVTDPSNVPSVTASSSNAPRPLTDEETIQSLVEGGMDPSFLDALPEDMRSEVIADHRHARQVQQRLSSITLPEHINSDWLAGLPPHIQEEVLNQFRQEQQQGTSGTEEATHRAPENNTAFLLSLPTALRREVLADMEESQFDMLPPELAAEARQLRREHEERIARNVQNGVLTQSFNSRAEQNLWRNITSTAGLIGSSGRWDVRFRSINQFLRYLRSTLNAASGSNTMLGLHNVTTGRGRCLVDHEGLTCLIVLLVGSSSCSQQRRHIIPMLKKVLRNLSCHYGTRNWIVGSLLSLFDSLSEKLQVSHHVTELQDESSNALIPSCASSSRVESSGLTSDLVPTSLPNNIFNIGFEAALGCWVRVFHPLTQGDENSVDHHRSQLSTEHGVRRISSSSRRHIIHPQAAVSVAGVLLDTLSELARTFPSYFYPRSPDSKYASTSAVVGDVRPSGLDQLRPSFWDVFDRLSQSPPDISSFHSGAVRSSRRVHGTSRKRQSSVSTKPITTDPSTTCVSLPMEVSYSSYGSTSASDKPEATESTVPARRRVSSNSSTVNIQLHCFDHLSDLLCHPLLQDRPMHQERLLSILAGIVKEFVVVRGQSMTSGPNPDRLTNATEEVPSVSNFNQHTTESQVPRLTDGSQEVLDSGVAPTTNGTSTSDSLDLISPIRLDVIKILCDCVLASKSTDMSRIMAAQLIIDMAKSNRVMKENILKLLSDSAGRLAVEITLQLQELIDEINSSKPDRSNQTSESQVSNVPSSSTTSSTRLIRTSFDVLPDRFSTSGQVVVIAGDSRSTQPANEFTNLQLTSVQAFSCPNNNQIRFRSILGLILRITCGDSSVNLNESIPMCAHDPFQPLTALPEFWSRLSVALEKLSSLPEQNAVLLLQPLLEAFCLAHLYLVKDSIMIRQRNTISRSARTNQNASGSSSLTDMVPVLQLRVEIPSVSSANRASQSDTAANESTTHLHMDVVGPMSPLYVPMEEERSVGDVWHCGRASVSSASNSNVILQFAEQHRNAINQTLRHYGGGLGDSPLSVFLVYPRVLDFDIKRRFFRQQLQALNGRSSVTRRYDDEPVVISRDRIFEDSYARLHQKSPVRWKHKFVIRFQHEEGQDAGGPLREWYLLMSREIFNPNYCLFRTSPADRVTYTINPSSYINSNHLSYFKFVGRFIAKAIYDNKLLECYFSRSFYKHILGVPLKFSDLESDDYDFYKGLEFLLKNHVSDLGYELTFSTEINEFGKTETRDLIDNGRNVPVTEHNKREYVRLVCQERMTGAIRQQLDAFLGGFYEIIPKRLISVFNEQELELLISGLPSIDIADLRAHTTYSKYQSNSPQIEWFWRALESFDQEDRARFLQFVTGTSKVPLGGFANLEGIHGPTQFQISRATGSSTNHLPSAHTCFNTLILPAYETYEHLRARLLTAIRECSEGYGMA